MTRSRVALVAVASFAIGVVAGGNLFSASQPRSIISLRHCDNCMTAADLAGLLGSVAIQKFPGVVPYVVVETDKTIALRYPIGTGFHFVIIPKKDLKDIGDISEENAPYLTDAYLVARHLIEKHKLSVYSLGTNGPGYQSRDLPVLPSHITGDLKAPKAVPYHFTTRSLSGRNGFASNRKRRLAQGVPAPCTEIGS